MGDNIRPVTDEETELVKAGFKREEIQWAGWYTESVNKKKTEQRICVVGRFRIYFFTIAKKEAKLIRDGHLLDVQEIVSKTPTTAVITFKAFAVEMADCAADELTTNILQTFENYFFNVPKPRRFKLLVEPESRLRPVEGPTSAALQKSCGGFSGTYLALCDYSRIPPRNDIVWDMDNLLPANHVKEFDMKEFEQPVSPSDFKALVDTLHCNTYFTGFIARDYKLDKDAMKILSDMLQVNETIERLHIVNADAQAAGFEQIGQALAKNKKAAITSVDWSFNSVQEKGALALGAAVATLPRGLVLLNIDHGDATKKGMSALCNSLKQNVNMARTLAVLNLAHNRMDAEGSQVLAAFLSMPNVVRELNIAYTNSNLDFVFPALMRGSAELVSLNVAGNKINPQGAGGLKQFLQSCSKLKDINFADTAIPVNIARDVMKGIVSNQYFADVNLNLAGNKLGLLGANMISGMAEELTSVEKIDLSNNELGDEGLSILAEGLCKNTCIKELNLADNFNKGRTKMRAVALDNLIELTSSSCPLEYLNISASPGQGIGLELLPFVYALATNDTLNRLDISGHGMGDKGGIALGKALQTNRAVQTLYWDNNNTMVAGLVGFKVGLERNNVLTTMPLPILDIAQALSKQSNEQTKINSTVIAISEALGRNQNPKSKFSMDGVSHMISFAGAGEREELNKLRFRIKAAGLDSDTSGQRALKDAEENDNYISALHQIQADMQQALEDEVASRLGKFAGELVPFLVNTHNQLSERLVGDIDKNYRSIDGETKRKLRSDLDSLASQSVDKDQVSKILALGAAQQITAQLAKSFVRAVETASDCVFDSLLDSLEDIYYNPGGSGTRDSAPRSELSSRSGSFSAPEGDDSSTDFDEPAPVVEAPVSVPPRKLPPGPPARNPPPATQGNPTPAPTGKQPPPPPLKKKPPPAGTGGPSPLSPGSGGPPPGGQPMPGFALPGLGRGSVVLRPAPVPKTGPPPQQSGDGPAVAVPPRPKMQGSGPSLGPPTGEAPLPSPQRSGPEPRKPSPRGPAPVEPKEKEAPAAAADAADEAPIKTHLTKDRPMGAAGRRRPQRKPQRRPMMEGAE